MLDEKEILETIARATFDSRPNASDENTDWWAQPNDVREIYLEKATTIIKYLQTQGFNVREDLQRKYQFKGTISRAVPPGFIIKLDFPIRERKFATVVGQGTIGLTTFHEIVTAQCKSIEGLRVVGKGTLGFDSLIVTDIDLELSNYQ